jgi:hypothetical protein
MAPDDDFALSRGDELLMTGRASARRRLDTTMLVDGAGEYVRTGRPVATGWLWRTLQESGKRQRTR